MKYLLACEIINSEKNTQNTILLSCTGDIQERANWRIPILLRHYQSR